MMVYCYLSSFVQRLLSWVFRRQSVPDDDDESSISAENPSQINTIAIIPLSSLSILHRLPPETRMLIWNHCMNNGGPWRGSTQLRRSNPHPAWGTMYALSSERVFMNEMLSLLYRSTAFKISEIYGIRSTIGEPSKHLQINLDVAVQFSRIVPIGTEDIRYPMSRRVDAFGIFFDELQTFLDMAISEQRYLWDEFLDDIDVNKTIFSISLRFDRTLDDLDFPLFHRLVQKFKKLKDVEITYLIGGVSRAPYNSDGVLIDPMYDIIFRSPGREWVRCPISHSNCWMRFFVRGGCQFVHRVRRWKGKERVLRSGNGNDNGNGDSSRSSSSSGFHRMDHLGRLARLADCNTLLDTD